MITGGQEGGGAESWWSCGWYCAYGDGELVELCMVMTLNLDSGAWCNGA